uniref:CSON013465 protein n=1 Tax=Culicoides sonorensis TaxID=179676 RepID=A0A336M8F2_CULSO
MKWLKDFYFQEKLDLHYRDIEEIKDWLETEQCVPNSLEEFQILLFLHSNYFDVENTKKTIKSYYKCRADYSELFWDLDLKSANLEKAHDVMTFCVLPELTDDGNKVVLCKLHDSDPASLNFAECLKLFSIVIDTMLYEEGPPNGIMIAFDMEGVKFGHVLKLGIFTVKHFLNYLQTAMPIRIKGLHFFNIVPCTNKIVSLCRPFMSQSLYEMLKLHESIETVFPHISQEIFPKDYQGKAMSMDQFHVSYFKNLLLHQDYLNEEEEKHKILAANNKKNSFIWSMFK